MTTTTADHHAPNDMSNPDFSDLTPDAALTDQWVSARMGVANMCIAAYRAGAQYAAEQLAGRWPEPITDRQPTAEDADDAGFVQFFNGAGWGLMTWRTARITGYGWQRTHRWEPPAQPPHPADTLAAIIREVDGNHTMGAAQLAEALLAHPDIRSTLEVKS